MLEASKRAKMAQEAAATCTTQAGRRKRCDGFGIIGGSRTRKREATVGTFGLAFLTLPVS